MLSLLDEHSPSVFPIPKARFVQYRYPLIDFIHEFPSPYFHFMLLIARQGQRSGKAVQARSAIKVSQLQT